MDTTYEIFKKFPEGPVWIECAAANRISGRLETLNETSPGEYFAYDVREARIVEEFSCEPGAETGGNTQ
jgi:hypothetical protein